MRPSSRAAQAWSFGLELVTERLDARIVEATTVGTIAAAVNDDLPGLRNSGIVSEEYGDDRAASAGYLSMIMPITLPDRASLVLRGSIEVRVPGGEGEGTLTLRPAAGVQLDGQPVAVEIVVLNEPVRPRTVGLSARAVHSDPFGWFIRGDSNHDGRADLSDAVYTLSWKFLGGPEPACRDAADGCPPIRFPTVGAFPRRTSCRATRSVGTAPER